jgi:hypothetical protein
MAAVSSMVVRTASTEVMSDDDGSGAKGGSANVHGRLCMHVTKPESHTKGPRPVS